MEMRMEMRMEMIVRNGAPRSGSVGLFVATYLDRVGLAAIGQAGQRTEIVSRKDDHFGMRIGGRRRPSRIGMRREGQDRGHARLPMSRGESPAGSTVNSA